MRRIIGLVLMLALVFTASGCGILFVGDNWSFRNYTGDWTDTYQFASGRLTVAGVNGSITVEVWDRDEVQADAHWSAKTETYQFNPVVEESDGILSLTLPQDRELSGVSWTVKVPEGLDVSARTSNGRVNIFGENYGEVTVITSNGQVNMDGSGSGLIFVNTSNGSINVASWTGDADLTTSNGSITAHLGKITSGRHSLTSSNGTIRVFLDDESAFDLLASTSNGKIRSELNGSWSRDISGTDYQGIYNNGGATLTLRTSNAHIWLHRP